MESKGRNKDFFDEIIDSLRSCEEESPVSYVARDILLEFYRPVPKLSSGRKISAPSVGKLLSPPPAGTLEQRLDPSFEKVRQNSAAATAATAAASSASGNTLPAENISENDFGAVENMSMEELHNAVSICSKCLLCRTRTNTVFGDGDTKARLMFIGEGPGADEDASGLPFVGKAGELLTKMINAMGFARSEVYIGNIVKCRPPENRTPEEEEISACLPYIKRQIDLIKPKAIVLLGATPLKGLFNMTGITRMRGRFLDYNGIPAMPTFHPAYLLRNPAAKADVWKDLQMVMKVLGKEVVKKKN